MSHQEIQERIDPYVDGELNVTDAREVELHLRGCEECRGVEQRIRALSDALVHSAPAYRAPAALRKNVRATLRREAKPERQNSGGWFSQPALPARFCCLPLRFLKQHERHA